MSDKPAAARKEVCAACSVQCAAWVWVWVPYRMPRASSAKRAQYLKEWRQLPPPRDPYDSEQWWEPAAERPLTTVGLVAAVVTIVTIVTMAGRAVAADAGPQPPSPPRPPPRPPRPPPPPPPPPAVLLAGFYVSDASTTTNGDSEAVIAICGEADLGRAQTVCVPSTYSNAGVRCCGTTASPGAASSCCTDPAEWDCGSPPCPCSASGTGYQRCLKVSPQAEAAQRCAALGKRLCEVGEIEANAVNGAGCFLDFAYVWSATPCWYS